VLFHLKIPRSHPANKLLRDFLTQEHQRPIALVAWRASL